MVEFEFPFGYEVELAKTRNSREDKIVFSYSFKRITKEGEYEYNY